MNTPPIQKDKSHFLLELKTITKSFPGVLALDGVNFDLKAGEVHTLLGENGAGKSTLMKIISGVLTPDSGELLLEGRSCVFNSPKMAEREGISIVHQELNLCDDLTIVENIFLGREFHKYSYLSTGAMYKKTKEICQQLDLDLDPNLLVRDLSISQKQMVEIAKALLLDSKIIIFDEPTSALTEKERQDLFKVIHQFKNKNCGIIYISHRLEELEEITDRVSVFRDGKHIATENFHPSALPHFISLMVGREIKEQFPSIKKTKGNETLKIKNLRTYKNHDINLNLFEGEIVGIAGLMGAGRTELLRAICGIDPILDGEVWLNDAKLNITSPKDAINAGIVLSPEDRKQDGLSLKISVRENISLPNLSKISNSFGVLDAQKEIDLCDNLVSDLNIKITGLEQQAGTLSGGNQQKIVIGKWMLFNAQVVIFDEPTRGIDVGAKVNIYHIMNNLKAEGKTVLFVSSELPEVIGLSDRVLVMCDGTITGELTEGQINSEKILELATTFRK